MQVYEKHLYKQQATENYLSPVMDYTSDKQLSYIK